MIKQLRVYQLDDETPDLPDMEKVTKAYPARECQHLQQSTVGFREFESIPGCRVIQVNGSRHLYSEVLRFRRSVPKAVLDREVRKRVKARVDRGDEVSRQDKRLLKEEVNHEMLPKMPQLETVIPVVFETDKKRIWVGAGSEGTADAAIELLRRSGLHFALVPIFEEVDLGRWLSDWMLQKQPLPESIEMGVKARIADPHEPKASIAISNENLTDGELQAVAASRSVVALEMSSDYMKFTLSHDGTLKSIKLQLPDETFDDLAHLASYTLLEVGNTLDTILSALTAPESN